MLALDPKVLMVQFTRNPYCRRLLWALNWILKDYESDVNAYLGMGCIDVIMIFVSPGEARRCCIVRSWRQKKRAPWLSRTKSTSLADRCYEAQQILLCESDQVKGNHRGFRARLPIDVRLSA